MASVCRRTVARSWHFLRRLQGVLQPHTGRFDGKRYCRKLGLGLQWLLPGIVGVAVSCVQPWGGLYLLELVRLGPDLGIADGITDALSR